MATISHDIVDRFIQLSGPLFEEVQQSGIFPDSKTFVDSIPKTDPREIMQQYHERKKEKRFSLKAFVYEHFQLPGEGEPDTFESEAGSMEEHIDGLWDYLSRRPDEDVSDYSTLIPLPHSYFVPGGRFREIYYWDTYFTAEGLATSGRLDIVENLARNFAWLVDRTGHIPNGNRYYYLSRSQPPFLVLIIDLIARVHENGRQAIQEYLPALEKEYAFWMQGQNQLKEETGSHQRAVKTGNIVLNRYWDDRPLPREESWREDFELATGLDPTDSKIRYRHLRAGAESGWDFTSRWFRDKSSINTIRTTEILPVDLNALLYFMEKKLEEWTGDDHYRQAAEDRKEDFDRFFWNAEAGYYFDFDWVAGSQTEVWSMAGAYPLFLNLASKEQADEVAGILESKFLKDGGLVSSLYQTGEQWDYPNGWAPLQWVAVKGLLNYGHEDLAGDIARRWVNLNRSVFDRTGKMMEKYNVCDLSLEAGGGEYPLQDGFGWTNGVAVALMQLFDL